MHLLTPGDTFAGMEFLGQKICTLRVVYMYYSFVQKNLPVKYRWK